MARFRKFSVVAALILSTMMWGADVAAHQHWDGEPELCEICLLPQAADPAAEPRYADPRPPVHLVGAIRAQSYIPPFTPFYRGRAPPA